MENVLQSRLQRIAASQRLRVGRYAYQRDAYDLVSVYVPPAGAQARHVLLTAGMHGDEPAGTEAVLRFLESGRYRTWPAAAFTVVPALNPWGLAHNTREGPGGEDLNRSFRRAADATRELSTLKRLLRRRPFDLAIDCHEDADAPGAYVVGTPVPLAEALVAAIAGTGPVHPGSDIDGMLPLAGGVVDVQHADFRALRRRSRSWAMPEYVSAYQQRAAPEAPRWRSGLEEVTRLLPSAAVETPLRLPFEQRVAMHSAAIDAAVEWVLAGDSQGSRQSGMPR